MSEWITIRGERWIKLEVVASCYRVDVHLLQEVYELGLLGPGESVDDSVAIASAMLDRVARALQLHLQQGLDPGGIAAVFAHLDRAR